ncbi:Ribosomal RNA small subunit methyltransferase G [Rhizobium sp. PDO1-076]|uniref:16S rRNA (guanine(527)-N(7))-methyltransferase RsmG n=1 Tax=Rhizobium sp. PDO1-076 TaxID=1125979 RepID=UPI00024E3100|nr:16S rRNA (guanine(527)-N(7))-methyltransferase RsmG [Rhizobium sp. PDO1-076]EHS50269.1 Ribosomal RNA small subunit methyltransferase G [Rhizobium sp. PDO1-076]
MLDVSRETQERLQRFAELFMKWSAKINLVAPSTIDTLWTRHIADSLQLRNIVPETKHWIDLGSGGGFPGIVTAIVLAEPGQGWVDLVESNHKKASFLRMALLETGGRGSVHPLRIEEAATKLLKADVISARALAELDLLLAYAEPWSQRNPELRMVFHKGRDYLDEIDKARGRWAFDLVTHQSAVEADSVILEIASLKRRG